MVFSFYFSWRGRLLDRCACFPNGFVLGSVYSVFSEASLVLLGMEGVITVFIYFDVLLVTKKLS